ncbi:MAG TPA: HDOD domain-containing protein, partial [Opitutales bacterium]|nr:HDOD domain-containing protein [Opitutales bacterium]
MEIMAQQKDKPTASAYTISLLHCLGKMVINFRCPTEYKGVFDKIEAENMTLLAAEKAVLGFTNPQVAEALLRKWDFKEEIATPIGFQERPMDAPVYKDLACMLHLAMWIAAHIGLNFGKHSWAMQTHPEAAEYLKFDEETLQEFMVQTNERLEAVQSMMGIKPGAPAIIT